MDSLRIAIMGCGIGGMAAGTALARAGHDVTLFERFPEPKPVGAGLLLQPSGLMALERLGLRAAVEGWGARVERLYGRTDRGRMVMDLHYAEQVDGSHGLGIHRAALFEVLLSGLRGSDARLRLGFDVTAIEQPDAPMVIAASGEREGPFDLVVDCSGTNSRLRGALGLTRSDRIYPWGALWATCPDRTGSFTGELRQVYRGAHTMIGILPIGRVPGSAFDGDHVAFFWSLRRADYDAQKAQGLDPLKRKVLAVWPEAAPILDEIKSFDVLSLATYRNVILRHSHTGRVLALGDAAHGTSPQLGQGANLAIIDALTLEHALRRAPAVAEALALWEQLRCPHVRFYQLASWALTPAFQSNSRVMGWLRDASLGPAGRVPGIDRVMRTTLSGVRKFPFGLWRMPD